MTSFQTKQSSAVSIWDRYWAAFIPVQLFINLLQLLPQARLYRRTSYGSQKVKKLVKIVFFQHTRLWWNRMKKLEGCSRRRRTCSWLRRSKWLPDAQPGKNFLPIWHRRPGGPAAIPLTPPYDRQTLADYLGVERSAMSGQKSANSEEMASSKRIGVIFVCGIAR